MSRAGSLQTWCLDVHETREYYFYVWESFRWIFRVCFHVSSLRRGLSLATPAQTQIDGVIRWCSSFCRFLVSPRMINYSDRQALGQHSNQSPSPSVARFGRLLEESCLFQTSSIKGNEDYMLLWPFNAALFLPNSSPGVWIDAILSLSTTGSLFDSRAWFLLFPINQVNWMCHGLTSLEAQ